MRRAAIVAAAALASPVPSLACSPPIAETPLSPLRAADAAASLVASSAVIVDGTIEWSQRTWRARSSRRGLERIPSSEWYPRVRARRVLKGASRPFFTIADQDSMCPRATYVEQLPPGTEVRLLLEPQMRGTPAWVVMDPSSTGSRADEQQVNIAVDHLIGTPRDPRAAPLTYPDPPPPE